MSSAAGLSKRRKEEVTEDAEHEEADHPVDGVDVNDDHVHVPAPAPEVRAVQLVASPPGQLTPRHGSGPSLKAWRQKQVIEEQIKTKHRSQEKISPRHRSETCLQRCGRASGSSAGATWHSWPSGSSVSGRGIPWGRSSSLFGSALSQSQEDEGSVIVGEQLLRTCAS